MQGLLSEQTRLRDALAAAGEAKLKARKVCVLLCVSDLSACRYVVSAGGVRGITCVVWRATYGPSPGRPSDESVASPWSDFED